MTLAVGHVYSRWEGDANALTAALAQELQVQPVPVQVPALAGPNDLVQWIANQAEWGNIASACAGWLVAKFGDDVYEVLKRRIGRALAKPSPSMTDLPSKCAQIVANIQSTGGDVYLVMRGDEFVSGQIVHPRLGGTHIHVPPMQADGRFLAEFIVEFVSLNDDAENTSQGQ